MLGIEFAEVSRVCMGTQVSKERRNEKVVIFRNSCTLSAEDSDLSYNLLVLPLYVPIYLFALLASAHRIPPDAAYL
jgi:hypothetical protein